MPDQWGANPLIARVTHEKGIAGPAHAVDLRWPKILTNDRQVEQNDRWRLPVQEERAWDLSQGCCGTAQLIITNNDKTGATKTFMALAEPAFDLSGRGLPHA